MTPLKVEIAKRTYRMRRFEQEVQKDFTTHTWVRQAGTFGSKSEVPAEVRDLIDEVVRLRRIVGVDTTRDQ